MQLYRYEIEYSNPDCSTMVVLRTFPVIRETAQTYYIKRVEWIDGILRKVSKNARNTYAYDNREDALAHFIRRTEKRISWYRYWIKECEKGLGLSVELAKKLKE